MVEMVIELPFIPYVIKNPDPSHRGRGVLYHRESRSGTESYRIGAHRLHLGGTASGWTTRTDVGCTALSTIGTRTGPRLDLDLVVLALGHGDLETEASSRDVLHGTGVKNTSGRLWITRPAGRTCGCGSHFVRITDLDIHPGGRGDDIPLVGVDISAYCKRRRGRVHKAPGTRDSRTADAEPVQ